ncbi:MAG: hypothetical protein IPM89_07835 [Candidatus Competibacteraceae bacterium]|nr:MAG: hypothetical protein IPM89_07835 [Candidatus Competibacteraceae bacterium]
MSLSPEESLFVEKRERLTKHWPVFGFGVLFVLATFAFWLWLKVPYLINPWVVEVGLEKGTLPESTVVLMAVMLPMVMLVFLAFASAVVLLAFAAFSNERRLIELLRREGVNPGANESR